MTASTSKTFEARVRVRYAETDQMGVVYYGNYFTWFEVGRVEFLRQAGFTYKEIEQQDGCLLAVVDARCRYKAPARYDDEILILTQIRNVRGPLVHFTYEIKRAADGQLLAEGETTHIIVDTAMRARTLPEKYAKAFREFITAPGE
jgi:acyl-CoA thioester hydrolase